ncbi:MAG: hypothetical protein HYX67_06170 [Candidatus Melainabacteria bacterium]|nr:hypothetical protein [Candidatus Melainabacteria bacterium]
MSTFKIQAKRTLIAGALLLSQSIYLTPLPVLADSSVRLAGQTMFTLPGVGADKRAETVQNNLDNALVAAKDRSPSAVNITYVKGLPVITLAGYQVVTVDSASAKAAGSTPAVLAGKWAGALRESLADQSSVNSYVSQLTGSFAGSAPPVAAAPPQQSMPQQQDEFNTNGARPANYQGSVGELGIKFNRLRTPDGIETPITAHLVGGIGKYTDKGSDTSDTVRGEGWKAKVGQTAIRGGVGAGAGAALGVAVGAIAGRSGSGAGRGAWSGAAIGGGVGAASMLLRKGRDVIIPSGTQMQLQLDAPATIAGGGMGGPGGGQLATPYGGGMQ